MVREEEEKSRIGYPIKPPDLPSFNDIHQVKLYIQQCNHMFIMANKIIKAYQSKVDQLLEKEKYDPI